MILIGNNLGERHRYLNSKVAEAVAEQKNFEELKTQPETCDVDKLFKIDIASKYKDINYILDVLKCGDVFYVTRALKCVWLYTDDYAQYVNTEYLENNIFPYMSMKMKRKMLTAISMHVRNAERAIQFYKYCVEARLRDYAYKFLVFTSDSFKLDIIKTKTLRKSGDSKFRKHLIGTSFELAQAYLEFCCSSDNVILELRYLYSVSQNKYLDILERYIKLNPSRAYTLHRIGMRISHSILNKHKNRVIKKPLVYINILHTKVLLKCLTVEDVESLAQNLLPDSPNGFWSLDFYNTYKFILEKLPANKIFGYIKQIYMSKYKEAEFEMRIEFYSLNYYEMLNVDEREAWALQHIERDNETLGIENYMWYKFVSYRKAVSGIKRYIYLTPDDGERSQIVNILPETARTQEDIDEILRYYYERHVNELDDYKDSFINKVIEFHDVCSFNAECWTTFDKLLYSLDVYVAGNFTRLEYKFRSLMYHILHDMKLPEALTEVIESIASFHHFQTIIKYMTEERKAIISKYIINFTVEKIKTLMAHPDYDPLKKDEPWEYGSIKDQIRDQVWRVLHVIDAFKRPQEDCPEIVVQFMELNKDSYVWHEMYKPKFIKRSEEDFVRWLKQDTQTAVDGIDEIRCNTYRWDFRLSRLFRKLKVYFRNDVGKEYLNYFLDYLSNVPDGYREYRNIKMAVVGVFYLADTEAIVCLLQKNAPATPKIDHMNIDKKLFQIQKAICRLAYHPRPPLPLINIRKYIVGDYVKFSLPLLYNYFSNLQDNEKFIESLLDSPLSIQKHGLRFAFKSYDAETLKPIIKDAWRKTKNVSLRMLLYETLFDRIINETEEVQKELYEVLKLYTSELNHDDHDNVYSRLVSDDLPDLFKGDFIEIAWLTVNKLSDKSIDMRRRISVIGHMENNIHLIRREFPRIQIIDELVNYVLLEKNIMRDCDDYYFGELIKYKWDLTVKYIVSFSNKVELQQSLELMQTIMIECLKSWNLVKNKTYIVQTFMQRIIETIMHKDPKNIRSCENMITIYQCILDNLRSYLRKEQIYLINWELKLSILCRKLIHEESKKVGRDNYVRSENIAASYGTHVGKIIINLVKNNEFYPSFYQSIADIVMDVGNTACNILDVNHSSFVYNVCNTLIDMKMTETHLLALFMLPRDPDRYHEDEHREIVGKIKKEPVSQEVRSFLYQKYVLSDYEAREYYVI